MTATLASGPHSHSRIRTFGYLASTGLISAGLLGACTNGGSATPRTTFSPPSSTASTHPGAGTTVTAAPETLTPGDIPDTTAYVPYTNAAGGYTFTHPEGWALTEQGITATFTDKYNGVLATSRPAVAPSTVASATSVDVPRLQTVEPAFALTSIAPVTLPGGPGVLIVYRRNSTPDPVTGRSIRQEVHRYQIYANRHEVLLGLYGAVGADNVDPYTRMSQSLRLS